ncbi:hypothetical protein L596_010754 [Steinernema carpocapsae]|uniref:Secreted protein n=1 Tax=Steinernema carpocapsae TaxID=34508 RepID=A0A4U5PJA0_STECR|nr:hypothetical protein L596_010754 [Steinernema carpocapsae]
MNYKVSQMFVITYLLLFCFHCSLHKCSQKRERTCLRDALASENTRLAAKHANTSASRPARHPSQVRRFALNRFIFCNSLGASLLV